MKHCHAHRTASCPPPPAPQVWRGEHYSASRSEYFQIKAQVASETFPPAQPGDLPRAWAELTPDEQQKLLIDRLKKYSQKVCGCLPAVARCGGRPAAAPWLQAAAAQDAAAAHATLPT